MPLDNIIIKNIPIYEENSDIPLQMQPEFIPLFTANLFRKKEKNIILITEESVDLYRVKEELSTWCGFLSVKADLHIHKLPWEDPFINNRVDTAYTADRIKLQNSINGKKKIIIITTISALSMKLETEFDTGRLFRVFKKGQKLSRHEFRKMLQESGYRETKIIAKTKDMVRTGNSILFYAPEYDYAN